VGSLRVFEKTESSFFDSENFGRNWNRRLFGFQIFKKPEPLVTKKIQELLSTGSNSMISMGGFCLVSNTYQLNWTLELEC
jgi:hypothetical protein